ncbi:hypothetical protein ACTD5D_11550 [Nocardia takedensis]|uniref:hypothetical protein n=1 Tax=Nocardia takedensis TaxID=259390 RepID=UPI003F76E449
MTESDTVVGDAAPKATARPDDSEPAPAVRRPAAAPEGEPRPGSRRVLALLAVAVALLTAATALFAWRADDSADDLAALRASLDTDAAAERTAGDYALRVSQVKAGDVEGWRTALKSGVTDQLAAKLSAAVDVVGPWLSQIDYSSTAQPLAAKVMRRDGDAYVVQVFVDMTSRSRQTPDGVVATAAYTVTLDRSANWAITEVGGVATDLPVPTPQAPR